MNIGEINPIGRRRFLQSGLSVLTLASVPIEVQALMSQVAPQRLTSMPHEKFMELVDAGESLLNKIMLAGTIDENSRYFIIVPDKSNIGPSDMKIYRGSMELLKNNKGQKSRRQIIIKDGNGRRAFPDAEVVRGKGTGARIRLNDNNFVILTLGTPVKTESLPEEEQTGFPWTYVSSTPPNKAFQTPKMLDEGRKFLRESIRSTFDGKVKEEGLFSQFSDGKTIEDVVDKRLIALFAIVEHMDIGTLADARDPEKMHEEYSRVLSNYALNRNLAYRYGKSQAGARGMMQITPRLYQAVSELYEDVDIGDDHIECATDNEKSILAIAIKIDDDLARIRENTKMTEASYLAWKQGNKKDIAIPIMLGVMYNFGTKYLRQVSELPDIEKMSLPEETRIYIAKIRYVWETLHGNIGTVPKSEKKNPLKSPRTTKKPDTPLEQEYKVRSTLKGRGSRLRFEKSRAQKIAVRAFNWHSVIEQAKQGKLVPVRSSGHYEIDPRIGNEGNAGANKPLLSYLTPVARHNLSKIAEKFQHLSGGRMTITSMNRTAEYVKKLKKKNPRATSPSSHEYGTTFDFRKIGKKHNLDLENYLLEMQKKGYIIVIRESVCYHVFSERKIP